jgi:2-polyprenyl-3-methyl-5-hydroxy-6-metoxy-1,4-benzoquinol methylase
MRAQIGRLRTARAVPARIDNAEQNLRDLNAAIDQTAAHLAQIRDHELPGLLRLAERSTADRIADSERAVAQAARTHTEQAAQHAESTAIATARAHAEAAVGDMERRTLQAAHEHATAAAEAAQTTAIAAAHEHAEAAAQAALADARAELIAAREALVAQFKRDLAAVRREATALAAVGATSSAPAAAPAAAPDTAVDAALYAALEDRFRGDSDLIAHRQRSYLELAVDAADAEHPVLDLGCGRGEWLRVLADAGISGRGVDGNPTFVEEGQAQGLEIVESDIVEFLRSAADGSYGMITMFQVVEHVPFPVLVDLMRECARVLRPGGLLVAETPNSTNLRVAASTFWLDPTHQKPLHPDLLKFVAAECGFGKVDGWFLNELGDAAPHADPVVERLRQLVDGPGDFSLLAWT